MSVLDRVIAAVTPPESEQACLEARTKAIEAATSRDWLDMVLQHHMDLEDAFAKVKASADASARKAALRQLGILLTGHAIAEEAVTVLGEYIDHHVEEEESETFPESREGDLDLKALGVQMAKRKADLMAQAGK